MSMQIKINMLNEGIATPQDLIAAAHGDEFVARIFFNRGYTDAETVRQMLDEGLYQPTTPTEFPNMGNAVAILQEAIESNQLIAVYGDYDVDGVTSTALLVQCLKLFTPHVRYHVPDRFTEGYGMNNEVIKKLAAEGVALIVTCDCGSSNINEIETAKNLGMRVIITDHHNLPDELPTADAILSPKLLTVGHRAQNISGCGMAYFLARALLEQYKREEKAEEFLDLVGMSLIADVVSLNGENRFLLKKALPALFQTQRMGLRGLFSIIEKDSKLQSEEDVAFQIAPRLNAAGRMDSARLPVDLLLSEDETFIREAAEKIDFLNKERKRVQQEIIDQAVEMVENKKKNKAILVLFHEFWHHGIIGIAAGKICEKYRKPAILLTLKEDGCTIVGSARSVADINIYEVIKACSEKLVKFGGHSQAAGLSLEKEDLESFILEIENFANTSYYIKDQVNVNVERKLPFNLIDDGLYESIKVAGPYGEGFPLPVFLSQDVTIMSDRKTEKNHHIMVLADANDKRIPAVQWFGEEVSLQGKQFDIAYKIGMNTYRGNSELQLNICNFIQTEGKSVEAFKGRFVDIRDKKIEDMQKLHRDCVVFYEGLGSACPIEGTVDRNSIYPAKILVFLSTPVNTMIFREVITLCNPEQVWINFTALIDYSLNGFLLNLMGMVKHAINFTKGIVLVENIAQKLGVEESIIFAGLKYVRAAGKIAFVLDENENTVYLSADQRKPESQLKHLEKKLKDALVEKNAYQQFMLHLEIEHFKEYLK